MENFTPEQVAEAFIAVIVASIAFLMILFAPNIPEDDDDKKER